MVFSSLLFLFTFLPAVLVLYYVLPRKLKNLLLLLSSLVFYAWGEPVYVLLMLFSIVVNYLLGFILTESKPALVLSVVVNIGLLGFFKYAGFFIRIANGLFGTGFSEPDLVLPIGISFYTFQALSYCIDVYKKKTPVEKNFLYFATYISFFPQLIAGPIVQYKDIRSQFSRRKHSFEKFGDGALRFAVGMGKKVIIANNVGALFKTIASCDGAHLRIGLTLLAAIAFTLQIYFDFSGYSDMATGLGKMFGFRLPENFNYPYTARSVTDFWRRWHMTLSGWFKEYVYIPLGGSKNGLARQLLSTFVVWTLTGFWHGADYNFIIWGLYYCLFLLLEKLVLSRVGFLNVPLINRIYTLIIVVLGWVIFAYPDLKFGQDFIKVLFSLAPAGENAVSVLFYLKEYAVFLILGIIGSTHLPKKLYDCTGEAVRTVINVFFMCGVLIISVAMLVTGSYNPFLYFRF
ncbi:MAG: MBOAT family protein [Lachnospiraceae bacterium]|nr:MBOAT family protein [Lachnospiraceae bacterium]